MKFNFINKNLFSQSTFINNSFWGLISTLFQTIFLSIFFIIISRNYPIADFSNFLIANTVYQLIVGFSSMGLGLWFIREYGNNSASSEDLIYSFIKIQTFLGVLFYLINIGLAYLIYHNLQIRLLSIILGTNIIFDNIIYALKNLNVAMFNQKKTAIIMAADGLLRLLVGCLLFLHPISLIILSILLVLVRLLTVSTFIRISSEGTISINKLVKFKITLLDFKKNVLINWKFILIVGSSIIFWRSSTIIISKFLTATDVANYEISYKIFSIFTLISIVASTTIYPNFVKFIVNDDYVSVRKFYRIVSFGYAIFAIISYAFVQSFTKTIIPLIFGAKYILAIGCMKEMFLTLLVFPTVFLQANLLVAMKKEKVDMLLNFLALILNLTSCLIALHFYKSLSVINYSIFGSFMVFHIAQNILLIKLKINSIENALSFYILLTVFVLLYKYSISISNPTTVFIIFTLIMIVPLVYIFLMKVNSHFDPDHKSNQKNPFKAY